MGSILSTILEIYFFIVIGYVVFSWLFAFNIANPRNPIISSIYEVCYKLVDPPLSLIRQVIPAIGGIDLSPIVLIVAVNILQGLVGRSGL